VAPFISGVNLFQLVMMISGRPGSGKAHLARIMCDYAYLLHGTPNDKYDTVVLNRHSRALCVLLKPTLSNNKVDSLKEYLKNTVLIILEDCNWFSLRRLCYLVLENVKS
jgi:chromosomal replication initiation ATPase DnaA